MMPPVISGEDDPRRPPTLLIKTQQRIMNKAKPDRNPTMFISTSFNNEVIPTVLMNYCSGIETPTDFDCLCGKDTTFGTHPGNRIFRQQILDSLPKYQAAKSKMDKMLVTKSVIAFMKKKKSRFLKLRNNGSWVEIDGQSARDKISHALRFAVSQQKKHLQESQSDTSSEPDCSETIEPRFTGLSAPPRLLPSVHKQPCAVASLVELSQPLAALHPPSFVTNNRDHYTSLRRPSFSRNDSAKGLMSLLSSTDDSLDFDIHSFAMGDDELDLLLDGAQPLSPEAVVAL